ncbi:MAG: hypothetical protein AB1757_08325 [Acidobacteriota bacterium]
MNRQTKRMLIGLGFTFGSQALISFVASLVFFNQAATTSPSGITLLLLFALTLGAFFAGGFIVGLMSDELSLIDSASVTLLTLILSILVLAVSGEGGTHYFMANWINDASGRWSISGQTFLYFILALLASSAGNYLGWHLNIPQENQFDRVALLIGLLGTIIGPFVLFSIGGNNPNDASQQGLPWYFLVIVILVVLVIIGLGFLMFMRESHHNEEISIHPPKDELAIEEK